MRWASATVGITIVLWTATGSRVHAEAAFDWLAPPECPDRAQVLASVSERVPAEHRPWRAVARVARHRGGYRLELEVQVGDEPAAQRQLNAATCRALADAAALLVALATAPQPSAAGPEAAAPAPTSTTSADARPPVQRAAPVPAVQHRARDSDDPAGTPTPPVLVSVGATVRLELGTLLQRPGFGLQPLIGLRWGPFHAIAGFTWFLPGDTRPSRYPSATVHGRAFVGELAVGAAVSERPLRIAAELVVEYGALTLEVSEIFQPKSSDVHWAAVGGGVSAAFPVTGGLEVFGRVAGMLPFSRPRALVRTAGGDVPVFTVSTFLVRFSAGVSYVFE